VRCGIGSSYLARVGDLRVARIRFPCLLVAFGLIVGSDIASHHDFFEQPRDRGPQAFVERIKARTRRTMALRRGTTFARIGIPAS
jgi:hypothetical protein